MLVGEGHTLLGCRHTLLGCGHTVLAGGHSAEGVGRVLVDRLRVLGGEHPVWGVWAHCRGCRHIILGGRYTVLGVGKHGWGVSTQHWVCAHGLGVCEHTGLGVNTQGWDMGTQSCKVSTVLGVGMVLGDGHMVWVVGTQSRQDEKREHVEIFGGLWTPSTGLSDKHCFSYLTLNSPARQGFYIWKLRLKRV